MIEPAASAARGRGVVAKADLAERLEVSRQSVNAIADGQVRPVAASGLPHRAAV